MINLVIILYSQFIGQLFSNIIYNIQYERVDKSLEDLANMFNAKLQGFIGYFMKFYKSEMYPLFQRLNYRLAHWVERKFKKVRRHRTRAMRLLGRMCKQKPNLFAHWRLGVRPAMI